MWEFSQQEITSPVKISSGEKFRKEMLTDCSSIYKWLSTLYKNKNFQLHYGWRKEMSDVLFRETEHGKLSKIFSKSIENCNDTSGLSDMEIPGAEIFVLVLSNPTHKR